MKKIILSCLLLCGSLSFAQTATTTATTTATPTTTAQTTAQTTDTTDTVVKVENPLDASARNIDRLLVYFNRYKEKGDMQSLAKLVSDENKQFYTNFLKYVRTPNVIFTLKRDMTGKIVKTPEGEYTIPAIMTLKGKETNVSITFVEEKLEKGTKWLISNSNLHIQPLPAKTNNNLGSNVVNGTKKNTQAKPVASLPVVKKPEPVVPAPVEAIPPVSKGFDIKTIIFIGIASILIIGSITGYHIFSVRKAKKILAASVAASAALTASAPILSEISPSVPTNTPPAPAPAPAPVMPSNVTVSTVEEIHNTPAAPISTSSTPEKEFTETVSVVANEPAMTFIPENIQEEMVAQTPEVKQDTQTLSEKEVSNSTTSLSSTPITPENAPDLLTSAINEAEILQVVPESVAPSDIAKTTIPAISASEMPVSDLFSAPAPEEMIVASEKTQTSDTIATATGDMQPHSLFDGVFDASSQGGNQSTMSAIS